MIVKRNKEFSFLGIIKKLNDWELKNERKSNKKSISSSIGSNNSSGYAQHTDSNVDIISPKHSTLRKIFDDIYNKYNPGWGDGDEYPTFYISCSENVTDDSDYRLGDIITEIQNPYVYRYNGKNWLMIEDPTNPVVSSKNPKRIANIKQELLRVIKIYKKDYLDNYGKDDTYSSWKEKKRNVDAVLNYLNHLEQEIKRANL